MRQRPPQVTINWAGILCFLLVIFVLVLIVGMHEEIAALWAMMRAGGHSHNPDDNIHGLMALGFILVTIVALVKILTQRAQK